MNTENFAYWLQGYLELREDDEPLTAKQVQIIKDHLALVFTKTTPERKAEPVKEEPDVWPSIDYNLFVQPDVYCAPATVTPAIVPEKLNVEEIVKKLQEKQLEEQKNIRVTCATETLVRSIARRADLSGGLSQCRPGTMRLC